jgi:hypothetical protein
MRSVGAMRHDVARREFVRTRHLEFAQATASTEIVFILVYLPETRAVLFVLLVGQPMLLRAVRRPATIGTLELHGLWLSLCVRMLVLMRVGADRAWRKLFDGFAARLETGKRRLGERMEEVVLCQQRWCRRVRSSWLFREPVEKPAEDCSLLNMIDWLTRDNATRKDARGCSDAEHRVE